MNTEKVTNGLTHHPTLGSWTTNVRSEYRKGRLKQQRVEMLEKLDGWKWNVSVLSETSDDQLRPSLNPLRKEC